MLTIYLVRHGETEYNCRQVCFGRTDVPLNLTGELQAEAAARQLAGVAFDAVWSSPRQRALATAERILGQAAPSAAVEQVPGLAEIDFGRWEGMGYEEIAAAYPVEYQVWGKDWQQFTFPGGESCHGFRQRVLAAWQQLILRAEARQEETILCTTHAGPIKTILLSAMQRPVDDFWQLSVPLGSVTKIIVDKENSYRVAV